MVRRRVSSDEHLEQRFQRELAHADAEGRIEGIPCRVCGSRYPSDKEADACCSGLVRVNGSRFISTEIRWRAASGRTTPIPHDRMHQQFVDAYAQHPGQAFPELVVVLLAAADGNARAVFRERAASLGISHQRWGSWITSLRIHGYIKGSAVPKTDDRTPS